MIIVVEGPNNVGKSTFINKLVSTSEVFRNYRIEHVSSKCPNDYNFHETILRNYDDIILDRFYVGETIYPDLYDRVSKITLKDIESLIDSCNRRIVHIFVDADIEFIAQAYKNKNETPNWDMIYKERLLFDNRYYYLDEKGYICLKLYHRLEGNKYDNDMTDEYAVTVLEVLAKNSIEVNN